MLTFACSRPKTGVGHLNMSRETIKFRSNALIKWSIWSNELMSHIHNVRGAFKKIMRLFLKKCITIKFKFFNSYFSSSQTLFKTNITFCYLTFKFWVIAQTIAQKCILRRLALVQVWLFISNMRIVLGNQKFNYSICILLSFTKFVCWAIVSLVLKSWMHMWKKWDFVSIILKNFRPLQFLSYFY